MPAVAQRLTAERREQVVLCAWDEVPEHPLAAVPDVLFVRGDLSRADVLSRACVDRARTAVVDGRDDNETVRIDESASTTRSSQNG